MPVSLEDGGGGVGCGGGVARLGAITFLARSHCGEAGSAERCGINGLPLTPNSITVLGRAQSLTALAHPNLCKYLDVIRGKHERLIVVSEYFGHPLSECSSSFTLEQKIQLSQQIVAGLSYLHNAGIVHRNLSPDNILINNHRNLKLYNYGLYYMTGRGEDVSFPIGQPRYLSPETILGGGSVSSDIWNLGIILLELFLGPLWTGLKPGPVLRRIVTLLQVPNPAERIAREHDSLDAYQELPKDIRDLIEMCLQISPQNRPDINCISKHKIFDNQFVAVLNKKEIGLFNCKMLFLYHWWQLAGGDIHSELKKQGLIKSSSPILSMPIAVLLHGGCIGGQSSALMDRRVAISSMDLLVTRLSHVPLIDYLPLVRTDGIKSRESSSLPRIIRERDTEYQFHRLLLFEKLLDAYPFTEPIIKKEASVDIPPLVRGEVWAALLGVKGDIEEQYIRIDKETPTPTDRQIEVDIPRCHQYCWLLSGSAGHNGLRRILKAWLLSNPQYVYWQGLDSLTAPFLYLNFNNEARAFACLSAFVPKYLHKLFLKDNSAVIREYLAKFWQLTAFHEPKLASHLHEIHFVPELFAIPWFLTMFSHVFPLHKILHLWDALLVEDGSLPLYMGVAILHQLRDTLLDSGFNECILLFSDLPEVDIEQCVVDSLIIHKISPKSISYRSFGSDQSRTDPLDSVEIEGKILLTEMCPRISCNDMLQLYQERNVCIIDIRPNHQFNVMNIEKSINIPYSSVQIGDYNLSSLGVNIEREIKMAENNNYTVVIVSAENETAVSFSEYLVKCEVPRVCILHGGIGILHKVIPPILNRHNLPSVF